MPETTSDVMNPTHTAKPSDSADSATALDLLERLAQKKHITLTPLRKEILGIFLSACQPLSAYQVLASLKQQRPTAEPPTVYRVIDYLVQNHILHRIETSNRYVFCSQFDHSHEKNYGVLFLCEKCEQVSELLDQDMNDWLQSYFNKQNWQVHSTLIEVKGICESCG